MTQPHLARARKLASLFFVAMTAAVAPACDLFFPASRTDAGPIDAPDVSFPWRLGTVNRGPHAPGTWLSFPVDDVTGSEVYLWVIEEGYAVPFFSRRMAPTPPRPDVLVEDEDAGPPDAGFDAATDAGLPRSEQFMMPLPILRAGVFHLAVGDSERPMTREVEVEVVLRAPPISREEASTALSAGMIGLGDDLSALLRSDDPDWQAMLAEEGALGTLDAFDATASEVEQIAGISADQYMAVPADLEPGLRELLWNSGMLESLAARASGVSMLTFGGMDPFGAELIRSPVQGLLFKLDTLSALLAAIGIVCDVVTIVLAVLTLPAGGEGALVGMAAKVLSAFFRAVIDNFIPSDPSSILELQHSSVFYAAEPSMIVPWARFTPQNVRAGSVFRSLLDVATTVAAEAIPGPGQPGVAAALRSAGTYILTNVPGIAIDELLNDMPLRIEIALPLDMGFYNISFTDILGLHPLLRPLAIGLSFLWDRDIVSPYDVYAGVGGATARANYESRGVLIADVPYATPSPTEFLGVVVGVRAFGFTTEGQSSGVQIVQMPVPYLLEASSRYIRVQQAPDPADRSVVISDEDMIVLDVNLAGGGTTRIVRPSTTTVRAVLITLDDLAGGRPDLTTVNVYVGGFLQVGGLVIPDGGALPVPLMLFPGANDIRVESLSGHSIGCGPSSTDEVCLQIEVPQAANPDRTLRILGDVGVSRQFRVWTPPRLPASGM